MNSTPAMVAAGLVSLGVITMTIIISPFVGPRSTKVDRAVIDQRWVEPEPLSLPKGDKLAFVAPEPFTSQSIPIQQERREAAKIEAAAAKPEPKELCARHGMYRKYFHRHNRETWRCVRHH